MTIPRLLLSFVCSAAVSAVLAGQERVEASAAEGNRIFLRRDRHNPQPFELHLLMQDELSEQPASEVQDRLNGLTSDGWTLTSNNALWIEFHRPL